jgi:hypothetical protein
LNAEELNQLSKQAEKLRDRIVGHSRIDIRKIKDFHTNPRKHDKKQQDVFNAAVVRLGVLDELKVNKNTMNCINGHMRRREYLKKYKATKDETWLNQWVTWLDLTVEEEPEAVMFYDQIPRLATLDKELTLELLNQIEPVEGVLEDFLAEIEQEALKDEEVGGGFGDLDFEDLSFDDDLFGDDDDEESASAKKGGKAFKVVMNAGEFEEFSGDLKRMGKLSGYKRGQFIMIFPPRY